jgi:hypothetical protein
MRKNLYYRLFEAVSLSSIALMMVQASPAQESSSSIQLTTAKVDHSLAKQEGLPIEESTTEKMRRACQNNVNADGQIFLPKKATPECVQLFNEVDKMYGQINSKYCYLPDEAVPAFLTKASPVNKKDLELLGIDESDPKAEEKAKEKLAKEAFKEMKKNCKRMIKEAKKMEN